MAINLYLKLLHNGFCQSCRNICRRQRSRASIAKVFCLFIYVAFATLLYARGCAHSARQGIKAMSVDMTHTIQNIDYSHRTCKERESSQY